MAWVDDMPQYGSMYCPRCPTEGRTGIALIRGVEVFGNDIRVDKPPVRQTGPTGRTKVEEIPIGELAAKALIARERTEEKLRGLEAAQESETPKEIEGEGKS